MCSPKSRSSGRTRSWSATLGDLFPYRQLIVDLVEKSRLPAMYGYREYVEAGGLMAYEADLGEARAAHGR